MIDPDNTSPVMTVTAAASYLKISRNAAYAAVKSGELPSLKIGRTIRIPRAALIRLLDNAAAFPRD